MTNEETKTSPASANKAKADKEAKEASANDAKASFNVSEEESTDKYELSLEAMLKAGVHFGHKKSRWNPKMEQYIFGVRNGVHVIDLERTMSCFEKAFEKLDSVIARNGTVLIVGTKKQAKDIIEAVAKKAGVPFVNERWLGGTFTNHDIIKKRLKYFVDNKEALEKGKLTALTKLERHKLNKKLEKIEEKMGGLVWMNKLPDLVIVLDTNKDKAAIDEARKTNIPMIGLIDSNSDPDVVDYPIPANDDAFSSLKYILGVFLKRILEARSKTPVTAEK
jgi:small subunit ribosomal protein S2